MKLFYKENHQKCKDGRDGRDGRDGLKLMVLSSWRAFNVKFFKTSN